MKRALFLLAAGTTMLAASCTKDYTCTCTYPGYFGGAEALVEVRNLEETNRAGAAAGCPERVTQTVAGVSLVGTCDLDD